MKRHFILLLIVLLTCCEQNVNLKPYELIPNNFKSVLKINQLNTFKASLETNPINSFLFKADIKRVEALLNNITAEQPMYVAFFDDNSINDFFIATKKDFLLFKNDSIQNRMQAATNKNSIIETTIDSLTIYHQSIGDNLILSNNKTLINDIELKTSNPDINKLFDAFDVNSTVNILFKTDHPKYSSLFLSDKKNLTASPYAAVDINFTPKRFSFSGIIPHRKHNDSLELDSKQHRFINQKKYIQNIAPASTASLHSLSHDDFSLVTNTSDESLSFLNLVDELSFLKLTQPDEKAIVAHSLDINLISEQLLNTAEKTEDFKNIPIYNFENDQIFKPSITSLFSLEKTAHLAMYKDFIIFSDTIEAIKTILTTALNNNTLATSEAFISTSLNLSDESSILMYKNGDDLSETFNTDLNPYNTSAVQFINSPDFTYVNGIIQDFRASKRTNTINEVFNISIDNDAVISPQKVKNYITKTYDIIIQDVANKMYLISSSGQVLWTKQLDGKILGSVEQLDLYKNNKLQFAFATSNQLYLIDRNGNDIRHFPKRFQDNITQPLSVFDYDNTKNYRLLITQGNNLLMYNSKGETVTGFKYKNSSKITTQPKHFRINRKDYIVFAAGQTLKILNRRGKTRIDVKDKIDFSGNGIFKHYNLFTTTNNLGQLLQLNTKGKLNTKSLYLDKTHVIDATDKTLVSLNDNTLRIRSKTVDLDFGNYTAPKIYIVNDKIYVTTTDLQAKKVYLFDSQTKPISNFPVFGTSAAQLFKLNQSVGLVTMSDSKTVTLYTLN